MHDNVRVLPGGHSRPLGAVLPRLPNTHVPRSRLFRQLLAGDNKLTLICAPAGYGKSVLLLECVRQAGQHTRVIWLELLGHALTPRELLARLAGALELPYGGGEPDVELAHLVGRVVRPTWIVLDDYPRRDDAEFDRCLEQLLERSPHTLRWWVGTRRRPDWSLPRLLLQGGVREVGVADLAFNEQELGDLLSARRLELSEAQQSQLFQQSSGWPAGICLQLLEDEAADLNLRQGASTSLMQEYLEREVLSDLSSVQRESLCLLAQLPRFSVALSQHVLASIGDEQIFAQLRQRQLLIPSAEGEGWYRLALPIASRLRIASFDTHTARVHVLACQWFAQHGMVREAVEHALLAGQPEAAASYLQRYGEDQLLIGRSVSQLLRWRDELPENLFFSSPRLIILQAWALIICGRLEEAQSCIAELGRFFPQSDAHRQRQLLAQYQVVMGVLQRQCGLPTAKLYCQEALPVLDEAAWSQQALCHQALAQQAAAEFDLPLAQHHCLGGLRLARQHQSQLFETLLSVDHVHLLMMQGECEAALLEAAQTLQSLRDAKVRGPLYARLLILSGTLQAHSGDVARARATLHEAVQEAESCEDANLLFGYLGLAGLAIEEERLELADKLLRDAEQQMLNYRVPSVRYRNALEHARGELCLGAGRAEQAQAIFSEVRRVLEAETLLAPSGFYDLLLKTRLSQASAEIALGNLQAAQTELQALLEDCSRGGYLLLATQVRVRLAEVLEQAGEHDQADEHLLAALFQAQSQQQLRPILELQRHDERWLDQLLLAHEELLPLRQRLLGSGDADLGLPSAMQTLSKRELIVLSQIAKGLSNQQVADALFISLHTVKSHARRINAKLGVERRTQAVALAKEQGLID
ncbi:LuxR C-terminal-related transcriptional regulator [Pseudomonas sp. Gutcm_11s]|uniref:LuxR C-terminal-related transcriptional regulator n=1 Tax=Pseudomonas sp. Gutcm_11s TaxID=3026088 RepID=UPI00235ED33F|nr:LuxR C-terminal-related transcriptional regulator [Pseudomonas sp. Gutcm_11s]MDD0843480.1 LuxR C-terminal-related transcriptional regulator [Pseudomonas sp. Gutcm_11s]